MFTIQHPRTSHKYKRNLPDYPRYHKAYGRIWVKKEEWTGEVAAKVTKVDQMVVSGSKSH
jgi:hypothetical protein